MTPAQFRSDFPEFADTTAYPDSMVTLWLSVSTNLVNAARWGDLTDIGIELVTAHQLTIATRDSKAGAGGMPGGAISGPVSSKSVDKVSVSYNTSATQFEGEAFWNMTAYGVRYLGLAMMMGAGGIQL